LSFALLQIDDHIVTNIPGSTVLHSQVFPYQLKLTKDTEEHMPIAVVLGLPAAGASDIDSDLHFA
jgi:hypothetical protein